MRYNQALKLHNEDEVIYKKTKETLTILQAYNNINPITNNPQVTIEAISTSRTLYTLTHKYIK